MKPVKKAIDRLEELVNRGEEIRKSFKSYSGGSISFDSASAIQWKVNCISFLKTLFGDENTYSKQFEEHFDITSERGMVFFGEPVSIIKAAKEDYENGYLFNTRTLIEAEIFSDILEQAKELLRKGHYQASAVVAGCVLEDGLRKLCDKNNITFSKKPTIEPMNVELAKIGIYNQFIKDKISSIGKLRNHAAHGEWTEFTEKNVEDMIRDVQRFMEDYFS